jgi:hypothetical protein
MEELKPEIYNRQYEFEVYVDLKLKGSGLDENEIEYVKSKIKHKNYKEGMVIIEHHERCDIMGVLLTGSLVTSYYGGSEKINNTKLLSGVDFPFVSHLISFDSGKKSDYKTIANEDSLIVYILRSDVDELYKKIPKLERVVRLMRNIESAEINTLYDDRKFMTAGDKLRETESSHPNVYGTFEGDDVNGMAGCNKNQKGLNNKEDLLEKD